MVRKPQPKEAARAIATLLKAKGVSISHSLALEIVATVEGYNDWNTMAASQPVKSIVSTQSEFTPISDEDGPFTILINGGYYDKVLSFETACSIAKVFAVDASSQGGFVDILNSRGRRIAAYLDPDAHLRLYEGDLVEDPASVGPWGTYLEDNWESESTLSSRQKLIDMLVVKATEALEGGYDTFVGIQEFKVNAEGRLYELDPPFQHIFHFYEGRLTLAQGLPDDIRRALLAVQDAAVLARIAEWLEAEGGDTVEEHLDELVIDARCEASLDDLNALDDEDEENQENTIAHAEHSASDINNMGILGQLGYLREGFSSLEEFVHFLAEEFKVSRDALKL